MVQIFRFVFVFFFLSNTLTVYSLSLTELVGEERAQELLNKGFINEEQKKKNTTELIPKVNYINGLVTDIEKELKPNMLVEGLYLYKKNDQTKNHSWTEDERIRLYNKTLELSTLSGIQYYSNSRKKMHILYESSEIIDHPDTQIPQKDPYFSNPLQTLKLYVRQKDTTFGDNIYRYTYSYQAESLIFVQENLTAMNWGVIPVVGKNKLRSIVVVLDANEYLLVYIVSMAKASPTLGFGKRVRESFVTRSNAVMKWFTNQANSIL